MQGNANFSIEQHPLKNEGAGGERGRLEIRIEPIAGRTPSDVNREQVGAGRRAEGALRSRGKHPGAPLEERLSLPDDDDDGGGGGDGGWDQRAGAARLGQNQGWLRAELTPSFFYYVTQLEPMADPARARPFREISFHCYSNTKASVIQRKNARAYMHIDHSSIQ